MHQYAFFTIPIHHGSAAADDLNRFLNAHRVSAVERQFVAAAGDSAWAVCVTYQQGELRHEDGKKPRVDYREVLNEADFSVFAKCRTLRKQLAESEGIPAYAVFTNEQLAAMVTARVTSVTAMGAIDGVGEARIKKYAEPVLSLLRAFVVPEFRRSCNENIQRRVQ